MLSSDAGKQFVLGFVNDLDDVGKIKGVYIDDKDNAALEICHFGFGLLLMEVSNWALYVK